MDINAFTQSFMESDPVQKTISEAFALDPTEAIKSSYILDEVMEEKRQELASLDEATKASPWLTFRSYMEYFRMYYAYIGMVHPMLSVGRDRIIQWRRAVDQYEKLFDGYFPYVSLVTERMFPKVRHLIPTELLELSGNSDRYIIAAYQVMLPEGNGGAEDYPLEVAGVMSFTLRDMDGEIIVNIDWLRSDKDHEDANALDALMAEMFYMIKDTPVSGISFDMRLEDLIVPDEELITDVKSLMKIVDIDPEGDLNTEILPIDTMTPEEFKEITSRYIKEEPGVYDNGIPLVDKNRYDRKLSFVAKKKGAVAGVLLVYKNYRDEIYIEMVHGDTDGITMELILTALEEVSGSIKNDQQV